MRLRHQEDESGVEIESVLCATGLHLRRVAVPGLRDEPGLRQRIDIT